MRNLLASLLLLPVTMAAIVYDCPLDWQRFQESCYKFVFYPSRTYSQALTICQNDGASLVSVNTPGEHTYLANWLNAHSIDRSTRWWTSGSGVGGSLKWLGDGATEAPLTVGGWTTEPWLQPKLKDVSRERIVYAFSDTVDGYVWSRAPFSSSLNFICETKRSEAFRINHARRDFTFGSNVTDLNAIERGPRFVQAIQDVVVVGQPPYVFLDCVARGNPTPTYRWFKDYGSSNQTEVTTSLDDRYGLTSGRLFINEPSRRLDEGTYTCQAENKFGTILSDPVQLSFGYVMEFSNKPQGEVRALRYQGTLLNCVTPNYNPAVTYQWFKYTSQNFIRPEMNNYLFISNNGKLYFSETQSADAGPYRCIVTLTSLPGQRLTTFQPPSRASLDINLVITGDTATNFGPNIHNDFPAVFPSRPLSGQDLRLECFAYGRLPLTYSWSRQGAPMPPKVTFSDLGRVMVIREARLDDAGTYTCHVRRRNEASDSKSLYLNIEAKPSFLLPLPDMHVDLGSPLTWRCEAEALPPATYTWYKDTVRVDNIPGEVEVRANVLTIHRADVSRHAGMYQCAASNRHGLALSSAQLRVLAFKPSFAKRPMRDMLASIGGNATLTCQPEAAPLPEVEWFQDGRSLGLSMGTEGRVRLLYNGNLEISPVQAGDEGVYRCTATNSLGSASSQATLLVAGRTTMMIAPDNTQVVVNSSSFLACQASWDSSRNDLVYMWKFNGHAIDIEGSSHYSQGRRQGDAAGVDGLFVQNAQFEHAGKYTCIAQTVKDSVQAFAFITVLGPPSEPAGVMASVVDGGVALLWTNGDKHGRDVISYDIEFSTNFNPEWRLMVRDWRELDALDATWPDKRRASLSGLNPGTGYRFRVLAKNEFGAGPPSVPTKAVQTPSGPPVKAPVRVGGGGGSVGTLQIIWQPLSEEDHNGPGIGYLVRWRMKDSGHIWRKVTVDGGKSRYVALVGTDNYFLEYEVMVTAFNSLGQGPDSNIVVIFSAEEIPTAQPRNLWCNAVNGTAMEYGWDPILNDRRHMKGRLLGVQVNFWLFQVENAQVTKSFIYGNGTSGVVIGMDPDNDYVQDMQVFNSAGLGPKSDVLPECSTNNYGPLLYPEYVSVYSHGPDSVYVQWRGISTGLAEETLRGYKMRYWRLSETIYSATDVVVTNRRTWGVITGLEHGVIYVLRVAGYNTGGDGKKAPPVYFTLGGQVRYNPATSEILAGGSRLTPSFLPTVAAMATTLLLWRP